MEDGYSIVSIIDMAEYLREGRAAALLARATETVHACAGASALARRGHCHWQYQSPQQLEPKEQLESSSQISVAVPLALAVRVVRVAFNILQYTSRRAAVPLVRVRLGLSESLSDLKGRRVALADCQWNTLGPSQAGTGIKVGTMMPVQLEAHRLRASG